MFISVHLYCFLFFVSCHVLIYISSYVLLLRLSHAFHLCLVVCPILVFSIISTLHAYLNLCANFVLCQMVVCVCLSHCFFQVFPVFVVKVSSLSFFSFQFYFGPSVFLFCLKIMLWSISQFQ